MMNLRRRLLHCTVWACLGLATPLIAQQSVDSVSDAVSKFDVPPRPVKTKPPRYPAEMREQGVTGAVVVRLVIDEAGKVMAADIAKSSHDGFREPALQAVKDWTFQPAQVGGKPVRAKVNVPLNFSIED